MTPATVFVSKPAKRAMPWSSWTTMSPVRRSANERSAPRRRARVVAAAGALLAAAAEQPVLGQDGELQPGGDEAVAQADVGEAQRVLDRRRGSPSPSHDAFRRARL